MRSRIPLLLTAVLSPSAAFGLEPGSVAGKPVLVDVSESGSVYYNFDNRDSKPSQVGTRANDDFGLVYNRLSVQATSGAVSVGVRIDNVWFYASPNVTDIALTLTEESAPTDPPSYFRGKLREAGLELSTRFIDWIYPAKYYVTYSGRSFEATVGDTSAQLGRGIVLSVRKRDELGSDTTDPRRARQLQRQRRRRAQAHGARRRAQPPPHRRGERTLPRCRRAPRRAVDDR
jgi:hypothetical protein